MSYQIETKAIEPVTVAVMRYNGNPHKYITEILFPLKAGQDNAGY